MNDAVTELRQWLAANWDPKLHRREWLERVVDSGWAAPSWPRRWCGRDLDAELGADLANEFRLAGASGGGQDHSNLWAGTLLSFGTDELKDRFMRELLLDRVAMCLLYSEPGAGSDLAGLQTRATRDGDEWIVTGQKVWTSAGHLADWGMLIARTDWNVPKHAGISFFWFPMRQPGVEVRPLRQATGDSRFNEIFITEARVPHSHMLGGLNEGWRVLQTALAYERAVMSATAKTSRDSPPPESIMAGVAPDVSLIDLARDCGRNNDPVIRQRLAQLYCMVQVNDWNNQRGNTSLEKGSSSSLVSLGKLAMSGILHTAGSLQAEILGAEATLAESARAKRATYSLLNAFFTSIGGGTDQIQRNIIGERILGLPKEPEVDKTLPFSETLTARSARR
jgi:alkylation response protein AidB-like acyl-CoA dehydrogenase